jgi:hypothetical protein
VDSNQVNTIFEITLFYSHFISPNWTKFRFFVFYALPSLGLYCYTSVSLCNSVIRSHYVTMVDNNRGRFFLAVEPAYADVEYVFFISSRWCYMLLLSCRLHNCRPHRLDCGGCVRACATYSSCGHAPYYTCPPDLVLGREI